MYFKFEFLFDSFITPFLHKAPLYFSACINGLSICDQTKLIESQKSSYTNSNVSEECVVAKTTKNFKEAEEEVSTCLSLQHEKWPIRSNHKVSKSWPLLLLGFENAENELINFPFNESSELKNNHAERVKKELYRYVCKHVQNILRRIKSIFS